MDLRRPARTAGREVPLSAYYCMKALGMGSRNLGNRTAGWDSVEDRAGGSEKPTLSLGRKNCEESALMPALQFVRAAVWQDVSLPEVANGVA
jgi:hypothetical protein